MGGKAKVAAALLAAACAAGLAAISPTNVEGDRAAVIQALLERDRSLAAVHFQVPVELYRQYLESIGAPTPPPVAFLAESGTYTLQAARRRLTLEARVELRVLQVPCPAIGVLDELPLGWQEVQVNGVEAHLPAVDGFLRFVPPEPGRYVITAKADLGRTPRRGRSLRLDVLETARTTAVFDSPNAWEVVVEPGTQRRLGTGQGTHVRVALPPLKAPLSIAFRPESPKTERPPRFEVAGAVAWNLDAGSQQVTANLNVTIAGGPADRIELLLPAAADRLEITGPDVAQVAAQRGRATVHLRGKVLGRTVLHVAFDLPAADANPALGPLAVVEGHWTDGTIAVTNTAGGSEVLPAAAEGLEELALVELPAETRAILSGPAVLAYRVAARQFGLSLEVLALGEYALRQSIADLAHYEVFAAPDGAMLGRVRYEVRNHTGQFLTLTLPPGAELLLARVNDQPCPVSPGPAEGTWLLPLERSRTSVMGLVSFPVEVAYLGRLAPLAGAKEVALPLPQIDLPIAYAWCQAYLPEGLEAKGWTGPMRRVERLSSETAKASLDYGRAALAPAATATSKPYAPAQAILARNYYLAGTEAYDRGEYAEAEEQLRRVVALAPQSAEGENARRLLANWEMLQGQFTLRSSSAKAAAAQVQREATESNLALMQEQKFMVADAIQAARAGKVAEAAGKLKAAQQMEGQLVQRGASKKELAAQARLMQRETEEVQQRVESRRRELREKFDERRSAGAYGEALELGSRLRELDSTDKQLLADMEGLAIAAGASGPTAAPAAPPPASEPAVRVELDVRDLVVAAPADRPAEQPLPEGLAEERLVEMIRQNVDPQSWGYAGRDISIEDGRLVAETSEANRKAIDDLVSQLRRARGPAVAVGGRIAVQRAKGLTKAPPAESKDLRRFIASNYDWQLADRSGDIAARPSREPDGQGEAQGMGISVLTQRLELNLGQKVTVDSFNVASSVADAEALGAAFTVGRNGLSWAVLDEAQVRSLIEVAEARPHGGQVAVSGTRRQETIVGTDALLANGMIANEAFAGEGYNGLNIADNAIALPHDRYLVIATGGQLTLVRAGAMQFWTEAPEAVEVVPTPQILEVPRVGQLVQFEKTLLDPADRLVLRARTIWKGVSP